ncbi:hypothetical protein [Bradyrhizobium sp. S3.9.1]|uniref:hypothetical protein n=1 Tax=Bradyrhizobium sp. S3.9.1 TaxID=3156431 RepID=UPI0033946C2D
MVAIGCAYFFGRVIFNMRKIAIAALCVALGGCPAQSKMLWHRADGQRALDNPTLRTQFEFDGTACLGERNKDNLSGVTVTGGELAGIAAVAYRSAAADTVQRGCMVEKGYLLVPEDQAQAKQAELVAVAEQKKATRGRGWRDRHKAAEASF